MILAAAIALLVLALLFVAPYVLYPALIGLFRPVGRPEGDADTPAGQGALPRVSVLIPAHNEALHMRFKLTNALNLDYPSHLLEIIVCSDGSNDTTENLVRSFEHRGVRLIRNEVRSGKATALNRLARVANGQLLLFSDASTALGSGVLRRLVRALDDERVGAATARYVVALEGAEDHAGGETEAGYWSFESRLRQKEAARDMLLGGSGAALLLRKELFQPVPEDTVNDDYVIPLRIRGEGHRIAYVADAVASEAPTRAARTLYYRWVRIGYGNYQMLWRFRRLFSPRTPRTAVPLLRKLLRTLGPVWLLGMAGVSIAAYGLHPAFRILTLVGLSLLAVSVVATALRPTPLGDTRVVRVLWFCLAAQTAYLHGAIRWVFGRREGIWKRASPDLGRVTGPAEIPATVRVVKRGVDLLGALLLGVVFLPVGLVAALAIKLDSKGPVLYVQERMRPGKGGPMPFRMLKLRSMAVDAEARTGPVWDATVEDDDRITRVGRVLRRFRLDELPQLINVLKGEMSIVGPRPERPFFTEQLSEQVAAYDDRLAVLKPGITGWAQVQRPPDQSVADVEEKLLFDLAYLAHLYRLATYVPMELRILWRTIFVMLFGK